MIDILSESFIYGFTLGGLLCTFYYWWALRRGLNSLERRLKETT